MEPTASTIGAIVQAITARYDIAMATGEWPDRPLWLQPKQQAPQPRRARARADTASSTARPTLHRRPTLSGRPADREGEAPPQLRQIAKCLTSAACSFQIEGGSCLQRHGH